MGPISIGIDIGQKRDPTAIAVAEAEERGGETYHLIHRLERLPLRTPYPEIAQRLGQVVAGVRARINHDELDRLVIPRWQRPPATNAAPLVYVDATGVGQPVVDLLAQDGVPIHAVYFTHGDRRKVEGLRITLGKAWLVSRLQTLLETKRILLPATAEAAALARELQDYEIKVDQDANDTYGAFRVGAHDDLVTALGLAVQPAPQDLAFLDPEIVDVIVNGWQRATYGS
jgi:hypothetical protein